MQVLPKPLVLIILDGWGYRENSRYNPTKTAYTPTINGLFNQYPWTLLQASGRAVGLPAGQIGNSEVGHLHIGAGRKVPQDLTRISDAIEDGSIKQNPVFLHAIQYAKQHHKAIHILGLISPGGVHSHENHIIALIKLMAEHQLQTYLHAFLDGRDVPPRSAKASLEKIEQLYQQTHSGEIASLIGRYYAMDRDHRWDRTKSAYDLLTLGNAKYHATSAVEGLQMAYARNENDEFVQATLITTSDNPPHVIQDGDVVIFMNFRADRARQLCQAFLDISFTGFNRTVIPKLGDFITLTEYAPELPAQMAYPPLSLKNTLGEFLASKSYKQLRIAETEKYAHVTYFLNGGNETPFANETRLLIPSPKVPTYDLQPEMSAFELTDQLITAIKLGIYDVIMVNYANPDMVGHTGIESAAKHSMEVIDQCLNQVITTLQSVGGEALITSDHGNVEEMFDEKNQQPHTAHTTNLVPLIYVGRPAKWRPVEYPSLDDIAPTFLYLMNLTAPSEMTGRNLLHT